MKVGIDANLMGSVSTHSSKLIKFNRAVGRFLSLPFLKVIASRFAHFPYEQTLLVLLSS